MSAAHEPDEVPDRVGPFRIEQRLGGGGMGDVYAARDADGDEVALKVLRRGAAPVAELRLRFEQEGRLRIEHPNVVRTLDAGVDEGALWIAFERLRGRTLAEILEGERQLSVEAAVELGIHAAQGLAAAHREAVVHRDIKPSNLFRCESGMWKILDFGVARASLRDTRLTATGRVVGTPAYLSPEQAGGRDRIGPPSDIWSLGVVLYEVLAGRHPFERGNMMATMLAIVAELPAPLRSLRRGVPVGMEALIARCLERSPYRRFADGIALVDALEAVDLTAPDDDLVDARTAQHISVDTATIVPGEQRVVALVLAEAITDREAAASAVANSRRRADSPRRSTARSVRRRTVGGRRDRARCAGRVRDPPAGVGGRGRIGAREL